MFNFIIAFITLDIILKNFDVSKYNKNNLLRNLLYIGLPLILVFSIIAKSSYKNVVDISWVAALSYILFLLYESRKHFLASLLIKAGLPYFAYFTFITFARILFPSFVEEYDDHLQLVSIVVAIWLFAYAISAKNQMKAIKKEQAEKATIKSENETLELLIQERTKEIVAQKNQLEETIEELKLTQNQLIQQEKLASLGELTAGIAHEIQNPLNFVNNFSEVSIELIEELKEDLKTGHDAADIIDDLVQNLNKISHHGKRASGIVKNMLEHSRASTGEKQWVDINALADEYIKLSYHGLRAKDKSFNSDFKLIADTNLAQIQIIPQDLGRVILNLLNNAFYAVQKKSQLGIVDYKPMVTVTTKKVEDTLLISVQDNGTGIPAEIRNKIFQPFFTTKPTGQGTGLGLSLSYDIITKGHNGNLEVESSEEGTTFIITLPLD